MVAGAVVLGLLTAVPELRASAGLIRVGREFAEELAEHSRDAVKLGRNGMTLERLVSHVDELVDAGRTDEALRFAREAGGPKIVEFVRLRQLKRRLDAALELQDLFAIERVGDELVEAGRPELAESVRQVSDEAWETWRRRWSQMAESEVVPSSSPGGAASSALRRLDAGGARLLKSIDEAGKVSRVHYAPANVKRFVQDFVEGALDPEPALARAATNSPELVRAWRSTPRARRVFLVGAGDDLAKVAGLRAKMEADGFAVFFYKFCTDGRGRLCDSQSVGAFFKTAGRALLVNTEAAAASPFVRYELATASRLARGAPDLVLVTPLEILAAGGAVTGGVTMTAIYLDAAH